jgi:ketosteroid isomerase-like protein
VSAENVRVVEQIQAILTEKDVVAALEDTTDQRVRRLFMAHAEPEFEVVMVGPQYVSARLEYKGLDGFTEAWRDWTSPFDRYEIEVEEMFDAGDRVVSLVAMRGRTRTGGAEIPAPAAAVWTLADGRVRRVEFHLERDAALRAAGIDPESLR